MPFSLEYETFGPHQFNNLKDIKEGGMFIDSNKKLFIIQNSYDRNQEYCVFIDEQDYGWPKPCLYSNIAFPLTRFDRNLSIHYEGE